MEENFKIPKGQIHWETICDVKDNPLQIITSDLMQEKWFLYNVSGEKLTKIETASKPMFEKRKRFNAKGE